MKHANQSDDEITLSLVQKAQDGDELAFSQLFFKYTPLMDSICTQYASAGAPSEQELRSEAMIAFWDAMRKYRTDQTSVTFGLFAQICIEHRVISAFRKWKKLRSTLSLDISEISELGADEDSNPEHYVIEQEKYSELRRKMDLLLSEKEREIWSLFIEGWTALEIADKQGISKKEVENAIFRSRKKLKQHIPPHTS